MEYLGAVNGRYQQALIVATKNCNKMHFLLGVYCGCNQKLNYFIYLLS